MVVVLLKLLLAPCLVAAASLAGRRWGQRVAGLVAALPIVGGPVLVFYALDHGATFVARAASQALSGISSLSAYCVVYAWLAWMQRGGRGRAAAVSLLVSWCVFFAWTALLAHLSLTQGLPVLFAAAGLGLGACLLPSEKHRASNAEELIAASPREVVRDPSIPRDGFGPATPAAWPFAIELGLRMAATAALVLTLTAAAGALGPELSGLLTPFPVASTVLLVAAHLVHGRLAVIKLLRGFLAGMWGFVLFCIAVALAAVPLSPLVGFGLGLLGVVVVQFTILRANSSRRRRADEPQGGENAAPSSRGA